jgi:hypothetical protein
MYAWTCSLMVFGGLFWRDIDIAPKKSCIWRNSIIAPRKVAGLILGKAMTNRAKHKFVVATATYDRLAKLRQSSKIGAVH